jgi:hypothetical protein
MLSKTQNIEIQIVNETPGIMLPPGPQSSLLVFASWPSQWGLAAHVLRVKLC